MNNTGLYIRRRESGELWQLFLGGHTATKPSLLYSSYLKHFSELHNDYEWVVLERREIGNTKRHAMYRIGCNKRVFIFIDREVGDWDIKNRYSEKDVECLSIWHIDLDNKVFRGNISNRICPDCVRKEWKFYFNKGD
jgi:hypothetical protein